MVSSLVLSNDQTARVWNASSGQLLATLQGHTGSVQSAVLSPDGHRIVTASEDKTAGGWNASSGQLLATLQGHTDNVPGNLLFVRLCHSIGGFPPPMMMGSIGLLESTVTEYLINVILSKCFWCLVIEVLVSTV